MRYSIKPSPQRILNVKRCQILHATKVRERPPELMLDIMVVPPVPFESIIEDWIAEILESPAEDSCAPSPLLKK